MAAEYIVVVEDDPDLAEALLYNLREAGYRAAGFSAGEPAWQVLKSRPPDLLLLDLMLPDISGLELCRRLRARPATAALPVLMLTARGEEYDRITGFEAGADDYLVKPFSMRELLLRIAALLRRAGKGGATGRQASFGVLRLDTEAHQAWVGENEVRLTALEFKLLATLVERRGRVQSRERLLADVWGLSAEVTTRTVDTHIRRLREKLGPAAHYIETLRGIGYRCPAEVPGPETPR